MNSKMEWNMDMENGRKRIKKFIMMDNIKMIWNMALEYINSQVEIGSKANMNMIKEMAMVKCTGKMTILFIKDFGGMEYKMVLELSSLMMGKRYWDSLKITSSKKILVLLMILKNLKWPTN